MTTKADSRVPTPPFKKQSQRAPGRVANMDPVPDHGEATYHGLGRLKDRTALITGGDSGIGRAVAIAFAREGADIGISYLEEHEDAQAVEHVVKEAGRRTFTMPGNIADDEHCRALVDKTVAELGRIDLLINNAAYQGKAVERFEDLDHERVMYTLATNVAAMFSLTRYALPHMHEGGAIINVASIQAYDPSSAILDYATSKGAIVAFTKGLSRELIKRGIRVNCVAPGPVWTPLVVQSFSEKKTEHFGANTPIGRPAQPVEIAPAFVFLASEEGRYVNGEVLGVTGGRLLG